jgi:hypothetical protein
MRWLFWLLFAAVPIIQISLLMLRINRIYTFNPPPLPNLTRRSSSPPRLVA